MLTLIVLVAVIRVYSSPVSCSVMFRVKYLMSPFQSVSGGGIQAILKPYSVILSIDTDIGGLDGAIYKTMVHILEYATNIE